MRNIDLIDFSDLMNESLGCDIRVTSKNIYFSDWIDLNRNKIRHITKIDGNNALIFKKAKDLNRLACDDPYGLGAKLVSEFFFYNGTLNIVLDF